jgi:hypothetical protein
MSATHPATISLTNCLRATVQPILIARGNAAHRARDSGRRYGKYVLAMGVAAPGCAASRCDARGMATRAAEETPDAP